MTENATILIPDISGYTEFLTKTELVHSAHIIHELLNVIVAANTLDFTLSDIEGDAVLFYRTGPPIALDRLVDQCLSMFANFHQHLKIIERDSVCPCGACQSASHLSLKCIVHYGTITEIQIARFTKVTGVDMVIAHRLLKNRIGVPEYILTTENYLQHLSDRALPSSLTWQQASEEYPAVGTIAYHYARLEQVKERIPAPPQRESPVMELGEDVLEIALNAALLEVYQTLIDLDRRPQWVPGMKSIERDAVPARVGGRHVCMVGSTVADMITVSSDLRDDHITYSEEGRIRGLEIRYRETYRLKALPEGQTALTLNVRWLSDPKPPADFVRRSMGFFKLSLERFKQLCECTSGPTHKAESGANATVAKPAPALKSGVG